MYRQPLQIWVHIIYEHKIEDFDEIKPAAEAATQDSD